MGSGDNNGVFEVPEEDEFIDINHRQFDNLTENLYLAIFGAIFIGFFLLLVLLHFFGKWDIKHGIPNYYVLFLDKTHKYLCKPKYY